MSEREKFYDWAADPVFTAAQAPANLPATYVPSGALALVPPNARVVHVPGQRPVYAYQPQPLPPYDPRPALMYGCGVMAFGVGGGAGIAGVGIGYGAYLMFSGMALATDAIIGVAGAMLAGAIMLVALKTMGGTRIHHFHQGDNSTFGAGR